MNVKIRMEEILKRLGSALFFINQTFPRFSPTCYEQRKARGILIVKKIVQIQAHLIFFPLKLDYVLNITFDWSLLHFQFHIKSLKAAFLSFSIELFL